MITKADQTILDVAVQAYGSRFAVFQILEDNPNIYTISGGAFSLTESLMPGQNLFIRDINFGGDIQEEKKEYKYIEVVKNQTLMDVAVQAYGNQFAVFQLLEDNPNIFNVGEFAVAASLTPGQKIKIRSEGDILKQKIVRNIPNKVTSYTEEAVGKQPYLADEELTFITTKEGTKILIK